MPNNSPKSRGEDKDIWTVKQLQNSYRDPHLIIIDVRSCGKFRGGPPDNSKEIASQYHQGHLFLALNLNLEGCGTTKAITEEIYSGVRSAGGSFIDTLIFAITSGFHFLLYDQDGSNIELIDLLYEVELTRGEDTYKFPPSHLHWLEGGFNAISKNSTLKKCCYDTKSLLGREEEIDEPAYSEILPNLFVGGAVCSEEQLQELREKGVQHIINVSNVERDQEGFNCIFINTDDDQTECLNRLFHDLANLIETFIESGEGVFVHCQRGLSRSPSIIMAYLMIKKHFTHYEAFEIVKEKRPSIGPRSNFMIQLCRLEVELSENGLVKMDKKGRRYSMPMQVYELSSMRCVKYEQGIQELMQTSNPKKKRGLRRYHSILTRLK